jgi:DNA-binding response OmpR family regulator
VRTIGDPPTLVVAVAEADVPRFPTSSFAIGVAGTTDEALFLMTAWRPRLVAVAWDAGGFDAERICAAAREIPGTAILATMAAPAFAPKALRAGCHGLMMQPLTANLIAARLGRLSRESPGTAVARRLDTALGISGTNQACRHVSCPDCRQPGAVAFDYSSHRQAWFACLSCESVWLGRRPE